MKVLLIDDHGDTMELIDDGNTVMDTAKRDYFSPCGVCGRVAFDRDYNTEEGCCKYCASK